MTVDLMALAFVDPNRVWVGDVSDALNIVLCSDLFFCSYMR